MEPAIQPIADCLRKRKLKITEKPGTEHQEMMAIVASKYAKDRWIGAWAKWIKDSHVSLYQLEKLIALAEELERKKKANACGFVRNRLQNKDWPRWGI